MGRWSGVKILEFKTTFYQHFGTPVTGFILGEPSFGNISATIRGPTQYLTEGPAYKFKGFGVWRHSSSAEVKNVWNVSSLTLEGLFTALQFGILFSVLL